MKLFLLYFCANLPHILLVSSCVNGDLVCSCWKSWVGGVYRFGKMGNYMHSFQEVISDVVLGKFTWYHFWFKLGALTFSLILPVCNYFVASLLYTFASAMVCDGQVLSIDKYCRFPILISLCLILFYFRPNSSVCFHFFGP